MTTESGASARADTRTAPELDDAFDAELEAMALAAVEPPPFEPVREPGLWRYLRFQARDFLRYRATIMLPMALLALWIFHHNWDQMIAMRGMRRGFELTPARITQMFDETVLFGGMLLGALGSLVSAAGIVSRDREGGHQKFLFAKPVRISRFYLQSFAVNGVGLMLLGVLLLGLTSAVFLRPVPMLEVLLAGAATYVAVGGLTFLVSTLIRADMAIAALLVLLSFPLRAAARQGFWWAELTSWLLPPLDQLRAFDITSVGPDKPTVVQAVGSLLVYGAAYVAAGVAVLKKRSIIR